LIYKWTDTIKDAVKLSGMTNKAAFIFGVFLTLYCFFAESAISPNGVKETNPTLAFYKNSFYIHWTVAYCLYIYATILPTIRVRRHPYGNRLFITSIVIYVIVGLILLLLASYKLGVGFNAFLASATPPIAVVVAILTLFIQLQVSSNNSRKNHALTSLLQMRDSDSYNKSAEAVKSFLAEHGLSKFTAEHINTYIDRSKKKGSATEAEKEVIEAVSSMLYALNYFEFLAVGVKSNALDGELIYNTMAGVFEQKLYEGEHLLNAVRKKQPKAFYCYLDTVEKWRPRWDFENSKVKTDSENPVIINPTVKRKKES